METQRQKYVNLTFVVFAALVAYILFSFFDWISATYDLEARVKNVDVIIQVASVVLFGVAFGVLYKSDKSQQYANEVMAELFRVTWPTPSETWRATIVVIIMVLIAGVFLGGLDVFCTWALKWIV